MRSITIWSTKANASCHIDCTLVKQQEEERKYWRDVLKRVVETIKFLAQRGLSFRVVKKPLVPIQMETT